jgi:hypothetical protein
MQSDKPKPFTMWGDDRLQASKNAHGTISARSSGAMALEFDTIRSR